MRRTEYVKQQAAQPVRRTTRPLPRGHERRW
jgi:hypothetical protein